MGGHNRYQSVTLRASPMRDALVCDLEKNFSEQSFRAVMPLYTDVATDPCSACRCVNSVSIPQLCALLSVLSRIFPLRGHKRYQRQKVHEPRGNLDLAIASHRSRFTRAVQRIFPMSERGIPSTGEVSACLERSIMHRTAGITIFSKGVDATIYMLGKK